MRSDKYWSPIETVKKKPISPIFMDGKGVKGAKQKSSVEHYTLQEMEVHEISPTPTDPGPCYPSSVGDSVNVY